MNKTFMVMLVLLLVLVAGGLIYSINKSTGTSETATTTAPIVQNNNSGVVLEAATFPLVVTSATTLTSNNTAIVVGTVNPKGPFTNYWYEYGLTTNFGSKTGSQMVGSGFVNIQAPGYITNLTKNTTYYFRLVAENQFGKVIGNQFTFKTTLDNPAPLGSVPTVKTISANNISRTNANINGEVIPNKSATQYWFEYGKTAELGSISAFASAGDGTSKALVSVALADLLPQTTYYFRLNAQNQFGTINGSILNFKTSGGPSSAKAPSVTTGSATDIGTVSATLHGTVIPNLAETSFWFEYSTNSSLLNLVLLQTTEHVSMGDGEVVVSIDKDIANLKPKTTYYFRIVAENSKGTVRGEKSTFITK